MPIVRKTKEAEEDLLQLWVYIAQDNETAANNIFDQIEQKSLLYAENPEIGRTRPEIRSNLRSFVIAPYTVFYQPIDEGIIIIRILHGSRDVRAIFSDY